MKGLASLVAQEMEFAVWSVTRGVQGVKRSLRSLSLELAGQSDLAQVVRDRPGRAIVREGMADVLVWLGECVACKGCGRALSDDYARSETYLESGRCLRCLWGKP